MEGGGGGVGVRGGGGIEESSKVSPLQGESMTVLYCTVRLCSAN